jgi:hypothetical protein
MLYTAPMVRWTAACPPIDIGMIHAIIQIFGQRGDLFRRSEDEIDSKFVLAFDISAVRPISALTHVQLQSAESRSCQYVYKRQLYAR